MHHWQLGIQALEAPVNHRLVPHQDHADTAPVCLDRARDDLAGRVVTAHGIHADSRAG
jgi:hypothetical protein